MNMRQMEGFCYLATTLNFSKAAEMMFLSQPAFSRMIENLEKELGCQLFIRSKTKPKLTEAGEEIYKHMKAMLRSYEDICSIAKIAENDGLGHLRFGILENGLTHRGRDLILHFANSNPHVKIEIKEYTEADIFHALEMEWIDFAIVIHFPQKIHKDVEGIVIETSRNCIAMNKLHPLAGRQDTGVEISELKDSPFIVVRENKSEMGYYSLMSACLENGFAPEIALKADSISSELAYIDCNLGCAMLTDALRYLAGPNVVFVPIKDSPSCEHWLIWKKDTGNQQVGRLLEMI